MRNPDQIKKYLESGKHFDKPIEFIYFDNDHEYDTLKDIIIKKYIKIILTIIYLFLARTNAIIKKML
ncbi:MAG: hypothetical protein L6V81_10200 [Clostridium sp.]|nr:MAG: hypothetical protein L6V81_10200 [Clostridium sp.]